ncbi:MAG: hypothetical protein ACRDIF_07960, partial [Actinomycetota bacterium]
MPEDYFLELIRARARPADRPWEEGIRTRAGKTLPFLVDRSWSGPSGTYIEEWSIRRAGDEILYRAAPKYVKVRGMQSVSQVTDRVD